MSEEMEHKMVGGGTKASIESADTTHTKIFVGGLAWETRKDSLQSYFEQFGEILEAVVITDRRTGRSKGYGFVNFKDPDSATRACQKPNPVIDGRRANCNIAAFGVQKKHQTVNSPQAAGIDRIAPASRFMEPWNIHGNSSAYFHPHIPQYAFPCSVFGYPVRPEDIYAMNFYNVYGGKQFASYYPTIGTDSRQGMYLNYYNPFYSQNGQCSPSYHSKMSHNSHQNHGFGTSPHPTSASSSLPTATEDRGARRATATEATAMRMPGTASERKS